MQQTRRYILENLRKRGQATVDDIVNDLREQRGDDITSVTVRHHLNILQEEGLITSPQFRRRNTPGRPQHVYALTDKAHTYFPNNYQRLAQGLLQELQSHLPAEGVNVILEGVAQQMAREAAIPDLPMPDRLDLAVSYLSEHGYQAAWEVANDGYVLHTFNCPYHTLAEEDTALCEMDIRLVATLLSVVPRRLSHVGAGDETCSYFIPSAE
jgi:DeoR family transcriptional regulator, suf operon transcriptional repressor